MKKKRGNLRKILMIIGIILVIFAGIIGYIVVRDLQQEDLLKKEIVNLSNKDLLTDNYKVEVKTTGDYAYIEEAIKTYYKDLADNVKLINDYLSNEDLIQILSLTNLQSDAPEFKKSYQILNETRTNYKAAISNIIDLCKEETIKDLIDKEKVSDYYYELYLNLMYTEDDLKELNNTKNEMQEISNNLGLFLDKVEAMIKLLESNSKYWYIEDNQLYFETNSLVNQYNSLYEDLNTFVTEKFSKYATDEENTDKENSNI